MLLQDSEKKTVYDYQIQGATLQKDTRNADQCYVNYESRTSNSYIPGGFSTKIIPYVDFTSHGSVSKIQTQDVCKTITLVSDVDEQVFITDILMRSCFFIV